MTTGKSGTQADDRPSREAIVLEQDPGAGARVAVACDWCGMLSLSGPSCEWCGSPFRDEDLARMARNAVDVAAALREMERRLERELRRAGAARRDAEANEARRTQARRELLELETEDMRAAAVADRLAAAAARRGEAARRAIEQPAPSGRRTSGPAGRIGRGAPSSP